MKDVVTIVVAHTSRQQGQSLLNVGQEFRLKAGADFLQRVNEPGHFVTQGFWGARACAEGWGRPRGR